MGENFTLNSANFENFYPKKMKILKISIQKSTNFETFPPKSANLYAFLLMKLKSGLIGRIFTYVIQTPQISGIGSASSAIWITAGQQ